MSRRCDQLTMEKPSLCETLVNSCSFGIPFSVTNACAMMAVQQRFVTISVVISVPPTPPAAAAPNCKPTASPSAALKSTTVRNLVKWSKTGEIMLS
jgi:hypothetical protein